ncbi:MAG: type II toxin-antitoxin system RelE/ParE family toxin [Nitrospinae bacterium]|nr:type II toxin-antitoxin system RelE/ParE family toxin [Nitrospinota bacterium]
MRIRNVVHRGLRRFIENNETSGIASSSIEKIRNMVTFLLEMGNAKELEVFPAWKAHQLTGPRKGTWSLSVTRNWRITFRIDHNKNEILDLDYEDYH